MNLSRKAQDSESLYDCSTPDFLAFINKLSKEHIEKLEFDGVSFFMKPLNLLILR